MILLGNGPSLADIDLGRIAATGLPTMSFNRAYLAWPRWPFEPRYYACLDSALMPQLAAEIRPLAAQGRTRFFLHGDAARCGFGPAARVDFVQTIRGEIFRRALDLVTDFGNVGATAVQILAALGHDKVLLVGVDARYTAPAGDESAAIAAGERDPDHFLPNYRRGLTFDTTTRRSVYTDGWKTLAGAIADEGIAIRSLPGTTLDCFPICDLGDGIAWLQEEKFR